MTRMSTGPAAAAASAGTRREKAFKEMGVYHELAIGPSRPSKRDEMIEHTGQRLYPAIEFEDG